MVIHCVAFGCRNEQDGTKPISFHTFPFKRPETLSLWVKAIRRENWYPSKSSRLCSEHFLQNDYLIRPGSTIRLLKCDAVPSVFSFLKSTSNNPRRKLLKEVDESTDTDLDNKMDIPLSSKNVQSEPEVFVHPPIHTWELVTDIKVDSDLSSDALSDIKILVDHATQTREQKTDITMSLLRRQVKTLKQKVKRQNLRILTMKGVLKEILKNGHRTENQVTLPQEYFEGLPNGVTNSGRMCTNCVEICHLTPEIHHTM